MKSTLRIAAALLCGALSATAQRAERPEIGASDSDVSGYRLSLRDQVEFSIFDEPDLSATQRIDGRGQIRIPLLGTLEVVGLTLREAEELVQKEFVERKILREPMVTIRILEYAPKEVSVLGAVNTPGKVAFPNEMNALDIVDIISQVGGFSNIARADSVRVTRPLPNGKDFSFSIDVNSMINGRGRGNGNAVMIYPGDVIWVPERLF